jgi:hypothetical protein
VRSREPIREEWECYGLLGRETIARETDNTGEVPYKGPQGTGG